MNLNKEDIRRIYARINAQDVIIKELLRLAIREFGAKVFDDLRTSIMEQGDILQGPNNDPDPEFTNQGRLETLRFLAQALEQVRRQEPGEGERKKPRE